MDWDSIKSDCESAITDSEAVTADWTSTFCWHFLLDFHRKLSIDTYLNPNLICKLTLAHSEHECTKSLTRHQLLVSVYWKMCALYWIKFSTDHGCVVFLLKTRGLKATKQWCACHPSMPYKHNWLDVFAQHKGQCVLWVITIIHIAIKTLVSCCHKYYRGLVTSSKCIFTLSLLFTFLTC